MLVRCKLCNRVTDDPNSPCTAATKCDGQSMQKIVCIHWARPVAEGEEPHIRPARKPALGQGGMRPSVDYRIACTDEYTEGMRYSPVASAVSCPKCAVLAKEYMDSLAAE